MKLSKLFFQGVGFSLALPMMLSLSVSVSVSAFADSQAVRARAELSVRGAEGVFAGLEARFSDAELVTLSDGSGAVTQMVLKADGREVSLKIVESREVECGSREIVAVAEHGVTDVSGRALKLSLMDHTKRTCRDLHPELWHARLTEVELITGSGSESAPALRTSGMGLKPGMPKIPGLPVVRELGSIRLVGNPQAELVVDLKNIGCL